jgi:hypothetical protein
MELREWKEAKRKTIVLTSGLEVTVRQLSPLALAELGPIPGVESTAPEDQWKAARSILKAGLFSPKIGEGEGEISLGDLSAEDITEITEAITKIGIRPDPTGASDSSDPTPQS